MSETVKSKHRYGMVINLDRCNGCGACMAACAVENNVAPAAPRANSRNGVTPLRVFRMTNGEKFPKLQTAFVPMMCQQCGDEPPCVSVCPQQAVQVDAETGVVGQIPERCFGCRYCMTACPYHARYFNWWDPTWPAGMEKTLNPGVSPRMRGVVEKCNFCFNRWQTAKSKAAAAGHEDIDPADYVPACVEACPSKAIVFGDLNDPSSEVSRLAKREGTFRFLESIGTDPKIHFHSRHQWVRDLAANRKESSNG